MSNSKLGVGIAGLGLIAPEHATGYRRLADLVEIRGVCDVDLTRAKAFAEEFGGRPYGNLDDLIDDSSIEAIDLLLPHALHYDAAMAVLNAGKHLLIEKPLAPTYAESVAICRRAEDVGVRFMVAENTRYMKGYQAAGRLLSDGTIGTVNHVRTNLSSWDKARLSRPDFWGRQYRTGGGLILDTGAHSFYLLKWLLGPFRELSASATQVFPLEVEVEVEDTAEVLGTLANEAHFICGLTAVSEIPHNERLELYGTDGAIIVDQMADPVVKVFRGHLDFKGAAVEGVPFGPDAWHPGGWHFESVIEEVADFVHSIVDSRAPLIDPYDCAYAIGVVEAAYEAIRMKAPVPVQLT